MNVQSDLTAGIDLGSQVAAQVMARSRTDGMSNANNQTLTAGFVEAAKGRGLSQVWASQEIPARPPMLPNYGAVMNWNFDAATKIKLRPEATTGSNSAEFTKALDELKAIDKSQTREQARIANAWADGLVPIRPPAIGIVLRLTPPTKPGIVRFEWPGCWP